MKYSLRSLIAVTLALGCAVLSPLSVQAQAEDLSLPKPWRIPDELLQALPKETISVIVSRIHRSDAPAKPPLIPANRLGMGDYEKLCDRLVEKCLAPDAEAFAATVRYLRTDEMKPRQMQVNLLYSAKRVNLDALLEEIRQGKGDILLLSTKTSHEKRVFKIRIDEQAHPVDLFLCGIGDDRVAIAPREEVIDYLLKPVGSPADKSPPLLSIRDDVRDRMTGDARVIRLRSLVDGVLLREYASVGAEGVTIYREFPPEELRDHEWETVSPPWSTHAVKPQVSKVDDRTVRFSYHTPGADKGDEQNELLWSFLLWLDPAAISGLGR